MPLVIYAPVKDGHHDPSIGKQVQAFLQKLYLDDTSPGLHIEPIKGSADPKVRTGRINDFYRAVLFKITGNGQDHYVYTGVWPHDEANSIAERALLRTNPVNALPELIMAEAAPIPVPAESTGGPSAEPVTARPLSVLESARPDLTSEYVAETFGLDEELVARAWAQPTENALLELAENVGGWRGDVFVGLAAGESIPTIRESLVLDDKLAVDETATEDERLLASMRTNAGQMQFAWIEDDEELIRVVEAGDLAKWRVFLHPEQRTYVEKDYHGAFRLSGGAGTGKTVVLVHRARRLVRANPDARILLTTYTRNLADEMKRQLKALDPGVRLAETPGDPGLYVAGVDQTANQILSAAGPETVAVAAETLLGIGNRATRPRVDTTSAWKNVLDATRSLLPELARSASFLEAEYAAVVLPGRITSREGYLHVRRPGRGVALSRPQRAAVWDAFRAYRAAGAVDGTVDFGEACAIAAEVVAEAPVFDHVLVDEGQDLTPTRWQFLRACVAEGLNDLFLAEDSQQRIYGRPVVLSRYGIRIVGRSRRLTLNYRTTAQVLHLATAVLSGETYVDLEDDAAEIAGARSARTGPVPSRISVDTFIEELDLAAEVVRRWLDADVSGPAIGILVRDQRTSERVARGLEDRELKLQVVARSARTTGDPQLMTMHRAKGMEFTHVLIFGANADMLPAAYLLKGLSDDEKADLLQRERSLFYVAATRARDELVVMWEGRPTPFLGE